MQGNVRSKVVDNSAEFGKQCRRVASAAAGGECVLKKKQVEPPFALTAGSSK
jgi:hypothetical protein